MDSLPPPDMPDFILKLLPTGVRRYRVQVDDQWMHVMEAGQGFPVLLLHGNPTWGILYRKVVSRLLDQPLRLIFPDLVGLGFSSKPLSLRAHTLENHARWLSTLLDKLGLDEMIFVGQDWGGPIGVRAFAERPERYRGMVILNTKISPPNAGFKPTKFHQFSHKPIFSDVAFRLLGFPQRGLSRVQGDPQSITGDIARVYRYPLRFPWQNAAPLALARLVPNSMEHPTVASLKICDEALRQFRGPSAIVWGDRDPILGRAFQSITDALPQATVTHSEAGHFLQEEVPELIARAIVDVEKRISYGP